MPRAGAALALAAAGARRLLEAADNPVPVPDPPASAAPVGHALSVRNLRFAWKEGRSPVFEDLSLDLPEGGRIALLGPSGIGKSTLAALLLKLVAPQEGRITLGGADYGTLSADVVRTHVACLTQDATLFDDSIAANLRLAAPGAPDAALWEALERAREATEAAARIDRLVVMGGSCQRTWEHAIPKTARPVGPRISVQFRPRGVR